MKIPKFQNGRFQKVFAEVAQLVEQLICNQ